MAQKLKLILVRLTFPVLFEPRQMRNADGTMSAAKYSAGFVFAKDHPAKQLLVDAITAVAIEKWGEKATEILRSLKAANKLCLHDGDEKSEYAGYPGNLFVNSSNTVRPMVVGGGPDGRSPITAADGIIYSGCYVNGILEVWAQQHPQHGKRINASLLGVQFVEDGERLSGGSTATADDFDAIPVKAAQAAAAGGGAASFFQ